MCTTISFAEPEIVLGHGRRVLFVNPDDLQIFKEIELPPDLGLKGHTSQSQESCTAAAAASTATAASGQAPGGKEQQLANQPEEGGTSASASGLGCATSTSVQNVAYSPDGQLLAVTTSGTQKALLLYRSRPENARLLSARPLARASSALRFCSDSSSILVTDKTGDCYQYDCVEVEAPPRLLLGHLSVVYDILWSEDQQHIITCDRDDKIRVTNYPATFDIHSYCLGHREFVSGLALLTGNISPPLRGQDLARMELHSGQRAAAARATSTGGSFIGTPAGAGEGLPGGGALLRARGRPGIVSPGAQLR